MASLVSLQLLTAPYLTRHMLIHSLFQIRKRLDNVHSGTYKTLHHKLYFSTGLLYWELLLFFSSPCAVCGKVNMWHQFLDISNTLEFIGKTTKTKLEIVRTTVRRRFFFLPFSFLSGHTRPSRQRWALFQSQTYGGKVKCVIQWQQERQILSTLGSVHRFSSLPPDSCYTRKRGNAPQLVMTCLNWEVKDQGVTLPNHCEQRNETSFKPLAVLLVEERDQQGRETACVCYMK